MEDNMKVGDRFRLLATSANRQMNYTIMAKDIVNKSDGKIKKGYFCIDEDNNSRFFSYPQFHMLKSHDVIEIITKDGIELE